MRPGLTRKNEHEYRDTEHKTDLKGSDRFFGTTKDTKYTKGARVGLCF